MDCTHLCDSCRVYRGHSDEDGCYCSLAISNICKYFQVKGLKCSPLNVVDVQKWRRRRGLHVHPPSHGATAKVLKNKLEGMIL
jgi:prenyltransferase beta subunit